MTAHVVAGESWVGQVVPEGAAIVLALEDDADETKRRVICSFNAQISRAKHVTAPDRLQIISMSGENGQFTSLAYGASQPTFMADRLIGQARLLAASAGVPVRLIVVDHARLVIGGDANDSGHVTELLRSLHRVAKETGAAILLLCHSPKSTVNPKHGEDYSASDVLGSGAFVDNARFAVVLTALTETERKTFAMDATVAKQYIAMRVIKSNYSEAGRVFYFRKTPVTGWGVVVPMVVTLNKPVPTAATVKTAVSGPSRLVAFIAQHPGRFTRSSLRVQSGKTGPLSMGEKAVAQALDALLADGKVIAKLPTPEESASYGHSHQVKAVLHVV